MMPPMNNLKVRQALAYGLDRQTVVSKFYAGRGQVATEFLPPSLNGYAGSAAVPKYPFDPAKAKSLLQAAGLTLPVPITFWYPTSVSRPYMPDPQRNAEAFAASLEQSGFKVTFQSAPWRPDYISEVSAGKAQIFLLGWTGDFGDPADFDNIHFGQFNPEFGFHNQKLFTMLQKADEETNIAKRNKDYQQAEIYIMKFLPVVPYVHSKPALAFQKNVQGYVPSPVSLESFATVYYK
jgi:peptide/nickel transport system substrate-binding protein